MNMKEHILMAMREQFDQWEELLGQLSEPQLTTPQLAASRSIKDVIAHVWSWLQVSIARMEAGVLDKQPEFPPAPPQFDLDTENDTDGINAWFFETYRNQPWPAVYHTWREGYLRFLELGEKVSERELLDSSRYPWLRGYSLGSVLIASYAHHQEHLDEVRTWFSEQLSRPR
jgi:hypothetical protein